MGRKNKQININVNVFAPFDLNNSNSTIDDKSLNKLSKTSLYSNELDNYDILILDESLNNGNKFKDNNDRELIYEVRNYNECSNEEELTLYTGKYIGRLDINNNVTIKIDTGYDKSFLNRMINYSNKIYFEKDIISEDQTNNEFLLLIEYLFLINLKKSLKFDFPKRYSLLEDTGFNIKGNINIKEYIKDSLNIYKGYPYRFKERIYDKDILSVISKAYSLINHSSSLLNNFNDINTQMNNIHYKEYLRFFNNNSINKALSSPLLNNECYAGFKQVVKYASLIITNSGFNVLKNKSKKDHSIKGYLIDITSLFELYIYSLIKNYFKDYKVSYQKEIKLYEDTFFKRSNFIDILMEKGNDVIVIDTKFKRMKFENSDLDRSDFHQIHSYSLYFKDLGRNVKFATLLYPSITNHESKSISGYLSNSKDSIKFGVSYIKTEGDMLSNEREFIQRLRDEIESNK